MGWEADHDGDFEEVQLEAEDEEGRDKHRNSRVQPQEEVELPRLARQTVLSGTLCGPLIWACVRMVEFYALTEEQVRLYTFSVDAA